MYWKVSSTLTVWICDLPGPKSGTWGTHIVQIAISESHGRGTSLMRGGAETLLSTPLGLLARRLVYQLELNARLSAFTVPMPVAKSQPVVVA